MAFTVFVVGVVLLFEGFGIDGDPSEVCVQLVVHETVGEDIDMARSLSVLTAVAATWI